MLSINRIHHFAEQWHRDGRDLDQLTDRLRAEVLVRPGGRKILAFAVEWLGRRQIVMNERLENTSLRTVVLAHECVHLLLGVRGISMCGRTPRMERHERDAWLGAAILAVPAVAAEGDHQQRIVAADALRIPVELVDLRAALNEYADESNVRSISTYRRVGTAYRRWYARFESECERL